MFEHHNQIMKKVCVCLQKALLIAPGQDGLLMATSNLTSVAMTNKKARTPREWRGLSPRQQPETTKEPRREDEKEGKGRAKGAHAAKLRWCLWTSPLPTLLTTVSKKKQ